MTLPDFAMGKFALAVQTLKYEGFRALGERLRSQLSSVAENLAHRGRSLPDTLQAVESLSLPAINVSPYGPFPHRGGSQVQLTARLRAIARTHAVAHLYPAGDRFWHLDWRDGSERVRFRLGRHDSPISAIRVAAATTNVSLVHVENLCGFPLDLIHHIRQSGLRSILSIHDYSLYCPRPHLIERPFKLFCDFCEDNERCTSCLRSEPKAGTVPIADHRSLAGRAIELSDAIIFPSEHCRRQYEYAFPHVSIRQRSFVIAPATEHPRTARCSRGSSTGTIAILGGLEVHKGALLIPRIAASLQDLHVDREVFVYGGGKFEIARELLDVPGIHLRGFYRPGTLARWLATDRADVAIFPAIWPETYGIIVDECLSAGVPVVAFDLGAVGERLSSSPAATLVPQSDGAEGLAAACRDWLTQSERPRPWEPPRPDSAAHRHLDVYRRLS